MKAKIAITVFTLTFVLIPGVFAQTNLNNLMKRCETLATVDMNVVMNRDKETREITRQVKTVRITNDKRLVEDFLTAFSRDKEQADKVIENISAGKTIPSLYSFTAGDKQISYTFSRTDDANASVTCIERKAGSGSFMDMFSMNNMSDMKAWGQEFGQRMGEWGAEFGPKMDAWGKEFGVQMESWAKELEPQLQDLGRRIKEGIDNESIRINGMDFRSFQDSLDSIN